MSQANKRESVSINNELKQILQIQRACSLSIWTIGDYIGELEKDYSLIYIAKTNQKVIGFLSSRLLMNNLPKLTAKNTIALKYSEAEILNFGVFEDYHCKGIGNSLLREFLQKVYYLSIKTVWLEVRVSNLRAINFYSKRGFIETQRRRNFYSLPAEDAAVMKFIMTDPSKFMKETKLDSVRDFEITLLRNPK